MSDAWPSAEEEKKRILILADSHGRNISGILSYVLRRKSEVLVIFKPNATLGCVAEDIDKLTTSFTMSDVVVLIGGTNDLDRGSSAALVSTVEGLQRRLQQRTQLIVATLPRRYDHRRHNRIIDELNGEIRALRSRYGHMKILELGDMGRDYHTNQGLHLNIKGKIKLCLKLCKEMDSLPRTSILSPPMRKVADFLKLFTLPDGHRFNYETPRADHSTDMNTSEVSQAPREKLLRVKLLIIDTQITVPTSVGEKHEIAENMLPNPFEVFLGPSGRVDDGSYSDVKLLRSETTCSYWTGNTFCICLQCHTNRGPCNVRMGLRKAANLLVSGSQRQITFTVTETGLKLPKNQDPVAIILTLDVRSFLNVDDDNQNVIYVLEELTVGTAFSKRMHVLKLIIKSKMRLVSSSAASRVVMTGTNGRVDGMTTLQVNAEDVVVVAEGKTPPQIVTFEDKLFNLRQDVVVFCPILIASSHEFVIYFHGPGRVEAEHYAEFFVINRASLVQHVRLPLGTYAILPGGPKHVHSSDAETRTELGRDCSLHSTPPPSDTDPDQNERPEDDVILPDTLIRALRQCLLFLKFKNLASNNVKVDAACPKQTRKSRNCGIPEIAKQLTKVTSTYLSCCGDFNSAMITRRSLKSEEAEATKAPPSKEQRDSENINSCSDRQV